MNYSKEQKESLIYLLHLVANADGNESKNERLFINEIANRFQIDLLSAIKNTKLTLPSSENERIVFFFHTLQMIEMDGKITTEEISLIKKIGFKLGLNPMLTDDLIELNIAYTGQSIPENEIPNILKKYMN